MKSLRNIACAFAAVVGLGLSGNAAAVTINLGTLDANETEFSREFWRIFHWGSQLGGFTDYYNFTLASPSAATGGTLVFDWGGLDLSINSVSLTGGNIVGGPLLDTSPGTFNFTGLGQGNYTLHVSGVLNQIGPIGYAEYSGSIRAVPSRTASVPEPATLALLGLGLAGLGLVRRKRAT